MPIEWTRIPADTEPVIRYAGNAKADCRVPVSEAFVDGSGSSNDPRIRRCGWAAAWLATSQPIDESADILLQLEQACKAQVVGSMHGNVGPENHTVPFAELYAILQVLEHTTGDITIWSDCWYTAQGFASKRWQLRICKHWRFWQLIYLQLEGRQVQLKWTKAHVQAKHLLAGAVKALSVFGNEIADNLAKAGAGLARAAPAQAASLDFIEGRVHLIRSRLIAIQRMAMDHYRESLKCPTLGQPSASDYRCVRKQIQQLVDEHLALKRKADGPPGFQGHDSHDIAISDRHFACRRCGACGLTGRLRLGALTRPCPGKPTSVYYTRIVGRLHRGMPAFLP